MSPAEMSDSPWRVLPRLMLTQNGGISLGWITPEDVNRGSVLAYLVPLPGVDRIMINKHRVSAMIPPAGGRAATSINS